MKSHCARLLIVALAAVPLVVFWPGMLLAQGERLIPTPEGFPAPPVPEDNPVTPAKIELGEKLFFDPALSSDGTVSCGTCHRPDDAFTDLEPKSLGVEGRTASRNSQSVLNAVYAPKLLWDGRALNLEDQVRYPLTNPREMNSTKSKMVAAISSDESYPPLIHAAFGDGEITYERLTQAIASYERTLVSGDSPFDRYYFGGDPDALSEASIRGWELFRGEAGCVDCHHFEDESPFFTDFGFHNTGIGWDLLKVDLGRYTVTRDPADRGRFRTPSLRNVAATPPYMHDGRFETLAEVVAYYADGPLENKYLDERIRSLELSERDREDLVEFLRSLTGTMPRGRGEEQPADGTREAARQADPPAAGLPVEGGATSDR
ncbi:MAG: cytochrome c peroxidase [Acidobacteriota bacterium]|jgi:cytochrome c peroxidase